jgi:hypothetical protein
MRTLTLAALAASLSLGACTTGAVNFLATGSSNFQQSVAYINQDLAVVAPVVAQRCESLQTIAGLLATLTASSKSAGPGFAAANASIVSWCQAVPIDINGTAVATAKAVLAAQQAYKTAKAGG